LTKSNLDDAELGQSQVYDPAESITVCSNFVGAFDDDKISEILNLPKHVKSIRIITLGYPVEKPGKFERIDLTKLVYYERCCNS
jgi:nitroreductase